MTDLTLYNQQLLDQMEPKLKRFLQLPGRALLERDFLTVTGTMSLFMLHEIPSWTKGTETDPFLITQNYDAVSLAVWGIAGPEGPVGQFAARPFAQKTFIIVTPEEKGRPVNDALLRFILNRFITYWLTDEREFAEFPSIGPTSTHLAVQDIDTVLEQVRAPKGAGESEFTKWVRDELKVRKRAYADVQREFLIKAKVDLKDTKAVRNAKNHFSKIVGQVKKRNR